MHRQQPFHSFNQWDQKRTLLIVNFPSKRQPSPWLMGIFMELSMWPTSWRPISSWMSRPTTQNTDRGGQVNMKFKLWTWNCKNEKWYIVICFNLLTLELQLESCRSKCNSSGLWIGEEQFYAEMQLCVLSNEFLNRCVWISQLRKPSKSYGRSKSVLFRCQRRHIQC